MVFSDKVLFLHVPKTGGTSVTHYLVDNLRGLITVTAPEWALSWVGRSEPTNPSNRREVIARGAHDTLDEAIPVIEAQGRRLEDFALILVVMRNPYDLELSRYRHFRRQGMVERPGADHLAAESALSGDLERFCETTPAFGRIERYYTLDGERPENLQVARFENLAADVERLVEPFSLKLTPMPSLNRSPDEPMPELTERAKREIEAKYAYLFDYYPRCDLSSDPRE